MNFEEGLQQAGKTVLQLWETKLTPIILIDGRAASGKSTFAEQLSNLLFKEGESAPKLIHMDDLYPGWDGLREGSSYLTRNILKPLSFGKTASWQKWDWAASNRGDASEPGNGWREFAGGTALIVEGCGSLSRENAGLADYRIWIDSEQIVRKAKFSSRDEGIFDSFWGTWAAQEDEFYELEKSTELANLIVAN